MNKINRQRHMSEPLSSHEIEDVLSSIRRLVSEDLRPAVRSHAAPAGNVPPAEAGKLLLTPALRVVAEAPHPAVPQPETPVGAGSVAVQDHWPPAVHVEENYDDEGVDDVAASGDSQVAAVDTAFTLNDPLPDEDTVPVNHGFDLAEDEVIWSAPGEPDALMTEDFDADIDEPGVFLHEAPGHWTAQDVPDVAWVEEESAWEEPTPMTFVPHTRKSALTDDPLARAWADRAEADVRVGLGVQGAQPSENTRHWAMPPATAAEPETAAEAEADAGPQTAARPLDGPFASDESEIDEEILREIVRDIIRQELAGSLGERITRNVRKLVRVEINRALAAREFE